MRHQYISPLVLGLLAQFAPAQAHAQLDQVQLRLQRDLVVPLRWDNVESTPELVGGGETGLRA